ncbi:hypothetical protein BH23GEM1_BH23GEM1_06630 [soil metagenome]
MIASNEAFVIAAYGITWIVLLGYLWRLLLKDARARAGHARVTARGHEASP